MSLDTYTPISLAKIPKSPLHSPPAMLANLKFNKEINFPVLALIVSGGHTELILMKKHLDYKIIGQTLDDAAGEAFDKAAKILKLGYPGGPAVSALAEKFINKVTSLTVRIPTANFPTPSTRC